MYINMYTHTFIFISWETKMTEMTVTETTVTEAVASITITDAQIATQAAKFAGAWDKTPARVLAAAKAAERLKDGGLSGDEIVDALKSAIALEHAASLNRADDAMMIADMAAGIRLSRPAVSQLTTAIARARQSHCDDAATVSAFYYAALNYVPSSELKRIAAEAEELATGHAEFVAECIVVARADAGAARRAKLSGGKSAPAKVADAADDSGTVESSVSVTKSGAAAFTLADILRAAEVVAADNPGAAEGIRKSAQLIVEKLAS